MVRPSPSRRVNVTGSQHRRLMLTPRVAEKADLGRHCFSYCNLLAGEFYFQQAAGVK